MILSNYSAAEYGERMAIERARIPRNTSDDWYTVARRKEAAPVWAPVAADVAAEELAAEKELARITPRNAELLRIADRHPAPQAWYEEAAEEEEPPTPAAGRPV